MLLRARTQRQSKLQHQHLQRRRSETTCARAPLNTTHHARCACSFLSNTLSGSTYKLGILMAFTLLHFGLALLLVAAVRCSVDVRIVDAAGALSNAGLIQISTDAGFGSVCGASPASADVICRSMGFAYGSISNSPCGFYGGADVCGAAGTPVVRVMPASRLPLSLFVVLVVHIAIGGRGRLAVLWI